MTTIEKLVLQGIRSFSPDQDHKQEIQFFRPLTIILGHNGAGKTTIIEALKNACTGELPPNCSRGQSFIFDPKVAGDTEVKAQIRLKFRTANKRQMVVIRSFQLTQKAKTQQFKVLESALQTRNEDGAIVSQSYRCADIDKMMPELLGVSTAVLENVVFCHQEELNWPLSEPSALKKKFDDIFAATRYTKALQAIREFRKEQTQAVKDLHAELGVLEAHRSHVMKLRQSKDENRAKIEGLKLQISETEKQMEAVQAIIREHEGRVQGIEGTAREVQKLQIQKTEISRIVQDLYKQISEEITDSDEDIQEYLGRFESQLQTLENDRQRHLQQQSSLEREKEKVSRKLSELNTQEGILMRDGEEHRNRLDRISSFVTTLSRKHSVPLSSSSSAFSAQILGSFIERLQHKLNSFREELRELKGRLRQEDEKASQAHSDALLQMNSIRSSIQQKEQRIAALKIESQKIQAKMSTMRASSTDISELRARAAAAESEYTTKAGESDLEGISKEMERIKNELVTLKAKRAKLDQEVKQRKAEQEDWLRLDIKRKEAEAKQTQFTESIASLEPDLERVLGHKRINPDRLVQDAQRAMELKKKEIREAQEKKTGAERNLATLKGKLVGVEENLASLKRQVEEKKGTVRTKAGTEDLSELSSLIEKAEKEAKKLRGDVGMGEALVKCYQNFIEEAQDSHACPVCERGMDAKELSKFVQLQQEKLAETPQRLSKKQENLKKAQSKLESLTSVQPLAKDADKIAQTEIPTLEGRKAELVEEGRTMKCEVDTLTHALSQLQVEESEGTKVLAKVNQTAALKTSLDQLNKEIQQEEARLRSAQGSSVRPFDYVKLELDNATDQIEKATTQLDKLRKEHETRTQQLSTLHNRFRDLKEEISRAQLESKDRDSLLAQSERCQTEIEGLQREIQELQVSVESAQTSVQTALSNRDRTKAQSRETESAQQKIFDELQKECSDLQAASVEIQKYAMSDSEDRLRKVKASKEQAVESLSGINRQIAECTSELERKSEMVSKQDMIRRNIEDNLKYRRKQKELEKISEDLARLSAQKDLNAAMESRRVLDARRPELQELSNTRSKLQGMQTACVDSGRGVDRELAQEQYKDIDERHKATLIKARTAEMANKDLESYYTALDKALMRYHSMKMKEINDIIKELWQKTYHGHDIDTIEISADSDDSKSQRSYNYRVVMKKGDTALDMRGRCSAGQKVLACLVIRLALAEAFCIDCGVLALDEPTTNLDADNVASLADALLTIIAERQKQSNFQLIVITHDEDFVQKLGRSEFVSHYYRVSKSDEGFSVIEKQSFME